MKRAFLAMLLACGGDSKQEEQQPAADCPKPLPVVTLPCDKDASAAVTTTGDDRLTLSKVAFRDVPGWSVDNVAEVMPAFLASCSQLDLLQDDQPIGSGPYGGLAKDWRAACEAARAVPTGDDKAARAFFEAEFTPYAASGKAGRDGKITGYYVQDMRGSRERGGLYQFPILARPADLVSIQLSEFISDGRSRRVWGREVDGKIVPYWTRAEMHAKGFYEDNVLLWLDDPVDAMAVQIEGSGRATMPDGKRLWVGFDGKNGRRGGRTYEVMTAMRALRASQGDRPRRWRKEVVERFHEIGNSKVSAVFFEIQGEAGGIGTQEVVLTPQRSIAVDRAVIPLSTPVFVVTKVPPAAKKRAAPWRKLTIAQDTGGAILGSIRADLYFGAGAAAKAMGSRVNTKGQLWLLLPKRLRFDSP